jgi:hypothetical protein
MAADTSTASARSFYGTGAVKKTTCFDAMCAPDERISNGTFMAWEIRRNRTSSKPEKDDVDQVNSAWRRYLHDINII